MVLDQGKPDGTGGKGKIFYLARPASGGMRSHLEQLLRRFSRDYILYLGAPPENDPAMTAGLPADRLFRLPLSGGISPAGDLLVFQRLCGLLRRLRPDLLHIHGFKAALAGLPAARLARVPVLVTAHNYPAHGAFRYVPAAWKILGDGNTHYIAVSGALAGELAALGIPRERITVIHNGIDAASFEAAAAGRPARFQPGREMVVGTAARFAVQKGLSYFLEAAAALAPLFPQMRFLVAGDGPERPAMERLACRLGLSGRLSFCGHIDDLPRRLAGVDIFVLPSLTEGFSLALLEAAAAGCAVVATRVGGIPEVIVNWVHGLLVPPADAVALARAVAALARNPALARRLALAGCERVRSQFTLERMLSRTAALYRRLAAGGECRAAKTGRPEVVR